jgi:hypothetical protein
MPHTWGLAGYNLNTGRTLPAALVTGMAAFPLQPSCRMLLACVGEDGF